MGIRRWNMASAGNPKAGRSGSHHWGTQKLGFGEFDGRTYVDVLKYKPKYIESLLGDIDDGEIPEKKRFTDRIQYSNFAITAD